MAHPQPIALPHQTDYAMRESSFDPASFTRHFLGSPISWRPSSLLAKSPDADRGAIANALSVFDREDELCKNYSCCGLHLTDLHALLEHFEDVHIVVLDPASQNPQAHLQIPFNPTVHDVQPQLSMSHHHQSYPANNFDPDDMELDIDLDVAPSHTHTHFDHSPSSGAPSPPDTPISTPLSAYPSPHAFSHPPSPTSTRQSSPTLSGVGTHHAGSAFNPHHSRPLAAGGFPRPQPPVNPLLAHPEDVFNPYARFASDYSSCMPGAQFNAAAVDDASAIQNAHALNWSSLNQSQLHQPGLPPALLFASSSSTPGSASSSTVASPTSTSASRVPSPTHHHTLPSLQHPQQQQQQSQLRDPTPSAISHPNSPISRHPPTLLLSKPFRCPKPNCNKSYKQANGLKYHMTHGSCNFAPPKDLEHVKDLLERKRRERELQNSASGSNLTRSASLGSVGSSSASGGSNPIPIPATEPTTPTGMHPHHGGLPGGQPISPTTILSLTYNDLSNISEQELREVEREAERRLRPFACGVGDCQRRYKNMNGLRYHYQHSGDHGAVGLALLANGQHECLSGAKRAAAAAAAAQQGRHHHQQHHSQHHGHHGKGSISVPVSRAGSVVVSRVGTPQPATTAGATGATTTTTAITPTTVSVAPHSAQFPATSTTTSPTRFFNPSDPSSSTTATTTSPTTSSAVPTNATTSSPPTSAPSTAGAPASSTSTAAQQQQQQQHMAAAAAYHAYAQQMQRQYQAAVAAQAQAQAQQQQQQGMSVYGYDYSQTQTQAQTSAVESPKAQVYSSPTVVNGNGGGNGGGVEGQQQFMVGVHRYQSQAQS